MGRFETQNLPASALLRCFFILFCFNLKSFFSIFKTNILRRKCCAILPVTIPKQSFLLHGLNQSFKYLELRRKYSLGLLLSEVLHARIVSSLSLKYVLPWSLLRTRPHEEQSLCSLELFTFPENKNKEIILSIIN